MDNVSLREKRGDERMIKMLNTTALVMAQDQDKKQKMVDHLAATGLFGQIKPLCSPSALFQHLRSKHADMICWAVDGKNRSTEWINKLQSHEVWHDLPLIAFADDQQSIIDGFQLGASDSMNFTIDRHELSARMNKHLQRWQRLLELRKSQEKLQKMALTDPLTGLGNRATFDMSIKQAAALTARTGNPYSLMLIDLDHFKKINDSYGHQAGDAILQQVARTIRDSARDSDICCRYGGEEFVIILQNTKARNAETLAERIHRRIEKISFKSEAITQPITVSIGISSTNRRCSLPPRDLIEEADQALYLAKEKGRNRTEIWRADAVMMKAQFTYNHPPQLAFGT